MCIIGMSYFCSKYTSNFINIIYYYAIHFITNTTITATITTSTTTVTTTTTAIFCFLRTHSDQLLHWITLVRSPFLPAGN